MRKVRFLWLWRGIDLLELVFDLNLNLPRDFHANLPFLKLSLYTVYTTYHPNLRPHIFPLSHLHLLSLVCELTDVAQLAQVLYPISSPGVNISYS